MFRTMQQLTIHQLVDKNFTTSLNWFFRTVLFIYLINCYDVCYCTLWSTVLVRGKCKGITLHEMIFIPYTHTLYLILYPNPSPYPFTLTLYPNPSPYPFPFIGVKHCDPTRTACKLSKKFKNLTYIDQTTRQKIVLPIPNLTKYVQYVPPIYGKHDWYLVCSECPRGCGQTWYLEIHYANCIDMRNQDFGQHHREALCQ